MAPQLSTIQAYRCLGLAFVATLVSGCGQPSGGQPSPSGTSTTAPTSTQSTVTTQTGQDASESTAVGTTTTSTGTTNPNTTGTTNPSTTDAADTSSSTGEPCTAVTAVFFDLGGTLVDASPGVTGQFAEHPDARELLATLREANISLGLITNVPDGFSTQDLRDLLEEPDLLDEFDLVLLSSQTTANPKPDPAIFSAAHELLQDAPPLERTAFVTEELAHIADTERMPTLGARAAGMLGVHLTDAGHDARADHTIPSQDLLSIADAAWLGCN